MKITKALFPVAGMGTRMLPATKSVPKELLPVYNTPILDLLVEECMDAGIEEIILVSSREKHLIEDYFDSFPELEKKLEKKGDTERLKRIQKFKNIRFTAVRQGEQHGDGHAMLCAEHLFSENEPFLVVFGDELTFGKPSSVSQLLDAYAQKKHSIIGVRKVPKENISSYGVVDPKEPTTSKVFEIQDVKEKPKQEDAPSDMAIIGKYICTSDIWKELHSAKPSAGGEIRLADGFMDLLKTSPISACTIDGHRFDTGSSKGYFLANLYYAMQHEEINKTDIEEVMNYA